VTGVLLWPATPDREPAESLAAWHHPAFVAHLLLAWGAVAAIGRWIGPHVARHVHRPHRRPTGWLHLALAAVVALTGIGLQVLPEAQRTIAVAAHLWIGLALPLAAFAHVRTRGAAHALARGTGSAHSPARGRSRKDERASPRAERHAGR
jgi:predicted MFS family arabinose efflux permease